MTCRGVEQRTPHCGFTRNCPVHLMRQLRHDRGGALALLREQRTRARRRRRGAPGGEAAARAAELGAAPPSMPKLTPCDGAWMVACWLREELISCGSMITMAFTWEASVDRPRWFEVLP